MSTSACSKLLGTLSGRGVPSERLPLQYKHQWLISAVNATGDGMSLWYNGKKKSDLGSLSMAANGINDKIDVTCFRLVSEKRVVISDDMKSKNGILMLLLKYSREA